MEGLFNYGKVTISTTEYRELIEKSQKYDMLFNVVYNRFKDTWDDLWDTLKSIDWERIEKLKIEENNKEKQNEK